jgi:hypothetical protein
MGRKSKKNQFTSMSADKKNIIAAVVLIFLGVLGYF